MKKIALFLGVALALCSCSYNYKEKGEKERVRKVTDSITYIVDEGLLRTNYTRFTTYCPSEGYVGTPEIAVRLADVILSSIYGEEKIAEQQPFSVNLDNGVWAIEGYLEEGFCGGSAYIEIDQKTGAVLKLFHSK